MLSQVSPSVLWSSSQKSGGSAQVTAYRMDITPVTKVNSIQRLVKIIVCQCMCVIFLSQSKIEVGYKTHNS